MTDDAPYLIWSIEHQAWWGPGRAGYTTGLSQAGHYTRAEALRICAEAIPGTAHRMGMLPEIPVLLADIDAMLDAYDKAYPGIGGPWA